MKKTVQPLSPSPCYSLFLALYTFYLSPSKHFVFLWYPCDTSEAILNWNKFISALFSCCCCYRHKPSLSRTVSAVIETYHLCFLLSSHRWCHIFKAIDEKQGSFHADIFFLLFNENLSALFTDSIAFHLQGDQSRWQILKTDDETQGHTVGRHGVWTAWGLACCRLTEQVKDFFFFF